MGGAYRRAFRLGRPSRDAGASVDEELEVHLELAVEELVEEGWAPEEARREALRRFGDLERTRRYCTDVQMRRGRGEGRRNSVDELIQDLRYAARTIRKAPGYAGLVVLTLAFGIAASTTVFSVMNPYFFRPLPFGDPDALVHVTQVDPVTGWDMDRLSLPIYEDWKARSRAFEDLAAYTYGGTYVTGPEGPEALNRSEVTANMFDVLGARPAFGRTFLPEDGRPGAEPTVILDHGLWQRRYLGDPGILGQAITLDGVAHAVVGVMPPDFTFPFGGIRLWVPVRESAVEASRSATPYLLVGRMAAGWTRERVDQELTEIQSTLANEHPDADGRWAGVTVLPMRQALNFAWDILRVSFAVLLGAVLMVLALACVNVASLTLARAGTRARDVAVRAALGAGRGRVVRQLVTESVVLALAGGALGVLMAYWITGLVGPVIPEDLYRVGKADIDGRVLAFTVIVTMATPLLFGLVPALSAARRDLASGLKEGSKGSGGVGHTRGRRVLVSVQVALAMVLLTGAGLMLRSFGAAQDLELGFDADDVVSVTVRPPESAYDDQEVVAFVERAIAEVGALAGVTAASAAIFIPLNHETSLWQYAAPDAAGAPGEEWPTAIANRTYPGYFGAMGIPVIAGRDFDDRDDASGAPVAIVSESVAERLWPQGSAVGSTFLLGDPTNPTEVTVVGVVGNVRHEGLSRGTERQVYRPALQGRYRRLFLVARTAGGPGALAEPVREALSRLDPDIPVTVRPMSAVVGENLLQWSIGSGFLSAFGAGALLLATLGIYGLISYSVSQRQRELGVRIAMGATHAEIGRLVVRDGLRVTAVGLAVGLAGALALGRVASTALFGVGPFDPLTVGSVLILFVGVAALASVVPARRAARTDPIAVLRAE